MDRLRFGHVYNYKNVPEQIYTPAKTAFSKGTFLKKYQGQI